MSNDILPDSQTIAVYTTDGLNQAEFTWLLRDHVGREYLNADGQSLLIMLHSRGDKIFPTWDTLMNNAKMSRATLSKSLKALETVGWLVIDHGRGKHKNRYAVRIPAVVVQGLNYTDDYLKRWLSSRGELVVVQGVNCFSSRGELPIVQGADSKSKREEKTRKMIMEEEKPAVVMTTESALVSSLGYKDSDVEVNKDVLPLSLDTSSSPVDTTPVVQPLNYTPPTKTAYYRDPVSNRFYLAEGNPGMGSHKFMLDQDQVSRLRTEGMLMEERKED